MVTYTVYALKHSDKPIYIGCTTSPLKHRLSQHLNPSNRCRLVREYMDDHGRDTITIEPFETISIEFPDVAKDVESAYVRWLNPICNATPDGQGSVEKHTPETLAKMSAAVSGERHPNYGKTLSPETRAKIAKSRTGKKLSAETRAKISKAHTGKKRSDETRAKISKAHTGKKHSDETRAKLSKAQTGKKLSSETRTKISKAKTGEKNPSYGKPAPNRHPVWQHYDEIVRLYNEEELTQQEIADKFGCGTNPIQRILKQERRIGKNA